MSVCPKPGHTVLAGEQARPGVAVQKNWRTTNRQLIEVIVELTVNNVVLFIKKLECQSQLGRVSAKSEPHCPTPSSLFTSRSMQYTLIPLTLFHEWNGRKCVQEDEERKVNGQMANFVTNKVRGFSPCLNEEPYMEVEQGVQTCRLQFRTSILHSWLQSLISWLPALTTSSIAKYLKALLRNFSKFLLLPTILSTLSSPAPILPGVSFH